MVGDGIYTLAEAARYTGVAPSTLRSWFQPRQDRTQLPIFESAYERVDGDFAISFVNLIEAHVAAFLKSKKLTPQYIRRVHQILKSEWGIDYPFATQDLRLEGKKIILSRAGDDVLIDLITKQMVFEHARPHLLRIDYDTTTQLARNWNIDEGVVINPKIGFGQPAIQSTGVSTLIVANQYLANNRDEALVARLFNIPTIGVINAFDFERKLKRIAA